MVVHTKEEHAAQAPKNIKLFINRPSIGFEDVEDAVDAQTAQTLELSAEDIRSNKPIALRYVRFQNVNTLHVSKAAFRCRMGCGKMFILVMSRFLWRTTKETRRRLGSIESTSSEV